MEVWKESEGLLDGTLRDAFLSMHPLYSLYTALFWASHIGNVTLASHHPLRSTSFLLHRSHWHRQDVCPDSLVPTDAAMSSSLNTPALRLAPQRGPSTVSLEMYSPSSVAGDMLLGSGRRKEVKGPDGSEKLAGPLACLAHGVSS